MANNVIDRNSLSGLIPEPVTREILQGAVAESAVLRMARRLPNMTSKTQTMNVLDMLPTAYWVNGEVSGTGAADSAAYKQTTKMAWDKKKIYAEEIAVIVPIPEAVLDDADYDIWGEVRPRLVEAFGKKIDAAILFGADKPATWRDGVVPSAIAAGNGVAASANVFGDIMGENGLIAKVELDGYSPNGVVSAVQMRGKLRGLVDTTGQPIFKTDMQGASRYALDGMDMYFPNNGAFDPTIAKMVVGDWSQLVYAIRHVQDFHRGRYSGSRHQGNPVQPHAERHGCTACCYASGLGDCKPADCLQRGHRESVPVLRLRQRRQCFYRSRQAVYRKRGKGRF